MRLVDAPLVEGAVAAAVVASAGADIDEVVLAAERLAVQTSSETLVALPEDVDLHARPAADFVRAAMRFDSQLTVESNGREADAKAFSRSSRSVPRPARA